MGGREAHRGNIAKVLQIIDDDGRFSADYLAQLRYDKSAEDGFDGICNKAMHLFTNHQAIETEPVNINFIFSNWDSKESQWSFLYTRLPYILTYAYRIVETVCAGISPTYPRIWKSWSGGWRRTCFFGARRWIRPTRQAHC